MKVAVGSDHRGYALKERIAALLKDLGHEALDFGTESAESADYPDFAIPVAEKVASGEVERGILVCGSGVGMSIAANKVRGVRAALCRTVDDARMTRRHNDSNVLTLGEMSMEDPEIDELIKIWLETEYEGGRHQRRLDKITDYENRS